MPVRLGPVAPYQFMADVGRMETMAQTPAALGYRMPAEWEPHAGTWLSWPRREGISFPGRYDDVLRTLAKLIHTLARYETVNINVLNDDDEARVRQVLQRVPRRVRFHPIPTNEPWCRDH